MSPQPQGGLGFGEEQETIEGDEVDEIMEFLDVVFGGVEDGGEDNYEINWEFGEELTVTGPDGDTVKEIYLAITQNNDSL